MIHEDYEFLRRRLKERSGLVLSADKQYLVESRLLPVMFPPGRASWTASASGWNAAPVFVWWAIAAVARLCCCGCCAD